MKRILSIFVACIMIVSVFGMMSVGAEDASSWTMPIDWSTGNVEKFKGWDIAKIGNWSLQSFTDLSDITTGIANDEANIVECGSVATWDHNANKLMTPFPYMGTDNNETQVQNKVVSGYYDFDTWYVNHKERWGGIMFKGHTADAIAFCADDAQKGAILFTAPKAGTYSYTETVAVLLDQLNDGTALTYEITVRKNGTVLDTFVPTDKTAKTLTGEVVLAAGDLLMFAFEQTSHQTLTGTNAGANDPACVSVSNVTVTRTGDAPAGGEGEGSGTVTPPTTNPDTSDNVIVSIVVAVVALFGIAYVSKKH